MPHHQRKTALGRDVTEATLEVKDEGVSISDEARAHLFEPFYCARTDDTRDVGFVIGLSRDRHAPRRSHRGDERGGHRNIFRVTLPLHDPHDGAG